MGVELRYFTIFSRHLSLLVDYSSTNMVIRKFRFRMENFHYRAPPGGYFTSLDFKTFAEITPKDAEAWAKQFDDPSRDAWQRPDAVLDFIGLAPDARVADLGAGTGYFAMRLARRVPDGRVLANDVEPDMVRYLGERAAKEGLSNLVPVQGKPDDPALPEAVDVAFMCNVYHHIEDRTGYFRKLAAQLRPGGRLVVVDFEKDAPDDAPGPPPQMRVAREVLVTELASAGFELVRADSDILPHQYIVELRVAKPRR